MHKHIAMTTKNDVGHASGAHLVWRVRVDYSNSKQISPVSRARILALTSPLNIFTQLSRLSRSSRLRVNICGRTFLCNWEREREKGMNLMLRWQMMYRRADTCISSRDDSFSLRISTIKDVWVYTMRFSAHTWPRAGNSSNVDNVWRIDKRNYKARRDVPASLY